MIALQLLQKLIGNRTVCGPSNYMISGDLA